MIENRRVAALGLVVLAFGCGVRAASDVPDTSEAYQTSDGGTSDAGTTDAGDAGLATPAAIALDVPFVKQNPELPRGCEVTSLAMVMKAWGIAADKMDLAARVEKVPYLVDGLYGNPNTGFVGDMVVSANPGYGVYHAPVARLANVLAPGRVVDLTGKSFDQILAQVAQRRPVWIVTNATFAPLAASEFKTWPTATGDVQITWHEHSVVVTGYDATTIFVNDPLGRTANKRLARPAFRAAWEQMGKQAIVVMPAANQTGVPTTTIPPCEVEADKKLHCSNQANVPIHEHPWAASPVVNTLRSTDSWFECWWPGEPHAGGNSTWYWTQGDDNAAKGFVPASALFTTDAFDANPTAAGLVKCGD